MKLIKYIKILIVHTYSKSSVTNWWKGVWNTEELCNDTGLDCCKNSLLMHV